MPVIRNPFRKNAPPPLPDVTVERLGSPRPESLRDDDRSASRTSLHRPDDVERPLATPRSTSAISIARDDDANAYKMSVVNDSGVYLPPSPPEKRSFWRKAEPSTSVKNRPPLSPPENEPFTISRESFDSYRRSFDISARSPVTDTAPGRLSMDSHRNPGRMSLDSRPSDLRPSLDIHRSYGPGRMSLDSRSPRPPPVKDVEEPADEFEEIRLNDDLRPKKRGIFSRFGGDHNAVDSAARPSSSKGHLFGRKEHTADAAHESELKPMDDVRQKE